VEVNEYGWLNFLKPVGYHRPEQFAVCRLIAVAYPWICYVMLYAYL